MIVPMKRYSYFVYEPEYQQFLHKLRDLGVVQVRQYTNPLKVEEFAQNVSQQNDIKHLQQRLNTVRNGNKLEEGQTPDTIEHSDLPEGVINDYELFTATYSETLDKIAQVESKLAEVHNQQKELEVWGDFDLSLIKKLEEAGYFVHFWVVSPAQFKEEWEQQYDAQVIQSEGRYTYFVTVTRQATPPTLDQAELQKLPTASLSQLKAKEDKLMDEKRLLLGSRSYLAYHPDVLAEKVVVLQNSFNMKNANFQGTRMYDDKLVVVEGWVPKDLAPKMEQDLMDSGIAFTELEIDKIEDVPVKLKNNRFTRVFEPLVELFSMPNYGELDPTPYIAPFFMVFFGICFGDSGYGLMVLIVASLLKRKAKPAAKKTLELAQWLGLAGVVIGFFSGSFFGVELVKVPFLASIREYFISSENMMIIAPVLGFIQIIFAKYIGALKRTKQVGFTKALSSYAWPTLIIVLAVLVGLPMIEVSIPQWATYVLYGITGLCVLLVLFYNTPGKNIFVNFGAGLWHTYNIVSGLLGDTLSYIRLFAIGLTGAVLGGVFNNLAVMTTSGLPILLAIPVGAFILVLGHGINFGLTTIGALVHPIRLIYVEYFNNSDFEGGGITYDPLRKLEVEKD